MKVICRWHQLFYKALFQELFKFMACVYRKPTTSQYSSRNTWLKRRSSGVLVEIIAWDKTVKFFTEISTAFVLILKEMQLSGDRINCQLLTYLEEPVEWEPI